MPDNSEDTPTNRLLLLSRRDNVLIALGAVGAGPFDCAGWLTAERRHTGDTWSQDCPR